MRRRRGQSILEYVIIFAVVVAAVLLTAKTVIRPAVERGMTDTATAMTGATGKLTTMQGTQ